MEGKRPIDAVQHPLVDHYACTGEPLLAGLEHEPDPACDLVASIRQDPGRSDQHRRVGVVPAGVGPPLDRGLELQASVLGHG